MLTRIRDGLGSLWLRTSASVILGISLLLLVLLWGLGSSPNGLSYLEKLSVDSSNIKSILNNPINAPYRLLQDLLLHINHSIFFSRLASVIVATLIVVSFFYLLRGWFGRPIAILTTVLLVFTPYFILASRSATPAIMYFSSVLLMATYLAANRRAGDLKPIFLLIFATGLSLYVPGMFWLISLMMLFRYKKLKEISFQADLNKRYYTLLGLLILALMLPLFIGLGFHPALIKPWLLIPNSFDAPAEIGRAWLWSLSAFFLTARNHEELIINRLPILNAAEIVLLVFGAFVMWTRLRRELLLLICLVLFICLLSGLNDIFAVLGLALPLLMIVVGMGLRYLYIEWRQVFPLNPIAKTFAIGLMSALVLIQVAYGIRYSLLAWPVVVAPHSIYVLK